MIVPAAHGPQGEVALPLRDYVVRVERVAEGLGYADDVGHRAPAGYPLVGFLEVAADHRVEQVVGFAATVSVDHLHDSLALGDLGGRVASQADIAEPLDAGEQLGYLVGDEAASSAWLKSTWNLRSTIFSIWLRPKGEASTLLSIRMRWVRLPPSEMVSTSR